MSRRSLWAGLAVVATRASASPAQQVDLAAPLLCNGVEEQWDKCPALPSCDDCVPVHCTFGAWGDWYEAGGCTQIKFRHRSINQSNNECGSPCDGAKIQTEASPEPSCNIVQQDCKLGDWKEWTDCSMHEKQSFRTRNVAQQPTSEGKACSAPLKETRPCLSGDVPEACMLSEWQEWTQCSVSCGDGYHQRMRRILADAMMGGNTCTATLQEVATCKVQDCNVVDCELAPWGPWTACGPNVEQKYRSRDIVTAALSGGVPCKGGMRETHPCPASSVPECSIGLWSAWSQCDKDCDGGQQFRTRSMLTGTTGPCMWNAESQVAALHDTQECNTQPCSVDTDCLMSEWSVWTPCSADCGQGTITRNRTILRDAIGGGKGCDGDTVEVDDCKGTACAVVDCVWGQWYDWSACSASCGVGTKRRSRIVAQSPRSDGALCDPLAKEEVSECEAPPCDSSCKNAEWSEWSAWDACSATCGEGFQFRSRKVAEQANVCGHPVSGVGKEFKKCSSPVPCVKDQDCELEDWTTWSECVIVGGTCKGVRERKRGILKFARGNGRACHVTTLRQLEGCVSESDKCVTRDVIDCELSLWTEWTPCTRTCGGGQRMKSRVITAYPKYTDAHFCKDPLETTEGCNPEPCDHVECVDCAYSDWDEWGDCTHCGGQRYRTRHVISMPTPCGKPCFAESLKEVSNCTSPCEKKLTCAWSDWSESDTCQAGCGGAQVRSRSMGFITGRRLAEESKPEDDKENAPKILVKEYEDKLFDAPDTALCTGTELWTSSCTNPGCSKQCEPRDCTFSAWSDWSSNSCLGLCTRSRDVQTHGNDCGQQCVGPLQETKTCPVECHDPVNCTLSVWSEWSACEALDGQRERTRRIESLPKMGGSCESPLKQTQACKNTSVTHCSFTPWGPFSQCTVSCGGGIQTRHRAVAEEAKGGGDQCTGSLEELQPCNMQACTAEPPVDCEYSLWTLWTPCTSNGQQTRERGILTFASGGGAPCTESVKEIQACGDIVDCEVSEWTAWDVCDRPCGGGQQFRHRQVKTYPHNGGTECPSSLHESQGCNEGPCPTDDCSFGEWGEWSSCSATCGIGQTERSRTLLGLRSLGGHGCEGLLSETMQCPNLQSCPVEDCAWQDWTEWSACTYTCDGGMRSRSRDILTSPSAGGKPCDPREKAQIEQCNTQRCDVARSVDGEWSEWEKWSPCSATCGSGVQYRERRVLRMAEFGGLPAYGDSHETRFCNQDISCSPSNDCVFDDWIAWSGCTVECNGIRQRQRGILSYGSGDGAFCVGPLKETAPCNPAPGEPVPDECVVAPAVDCQMGEWEAWSPCSAKCGGGEHVRRRVILVAASGGGKPCESATSEVEECARNPCFQEEPVDCLLSGWNDWGACDECGGQRTRYRRVEKQPLHGGKPCDLESTKEEGPCPVTCGNRGVCTWQSWGDWGSCNAACGEGRRQRTRHLARSKAAEALAPADRAEVSGELAVRREYEELQLKAVSLQHVDRRELVAAFVGGSVVFGAVLVAFRAFAAARSREAHYDNLQSRIEMPLVE